MRAERRGKQLILTLGLIEARVVETVLAAVVENYRKKPDELDGRAAQAWYSTRGCRSANMSAEETREWIENLHQLKSGNVAVIEDCLRQLRSAKGRSRIKLSAAQCEKLLVVLNDHRLYLAAQNDIGQTEMDIRELESLQRMDVPRQLALYEIHCLAGIIQSLLEFAAPEAANWNLDEPPPESGEDTDAAV